MKAPQPGRFVAGVFVPEWLDSVVADVRFDGRDIMACHDPECEFRTVSLACLIDHERQEHPCRKTYTDLRILR